MSRIEEALNRVARAGALTEEESFPETDLRAAHRSSSLEQYPLEVAPIHPVSAVEPLERFTLTRPEEVLHEPVEAPHHLSLLTSGKLVLSNAAAAVLVEQYRRLAATLYEVQFEKDLKSVIVSSALPREGKTLTAVNLALTLAESYHRRVLLVDADLRAPSIHDLLKVPCSPGLGDYLSVPGASFSSVSVSPHLSVLPAGSNMANPIAGRVSDRMAALVRDASSQYDWVILDTPPVGLLPDANLVARLAQAVLFVVAAGSTPFAIVQRAVAQIGPERMLGVVLNRAADAVLPSSAQYSRYSAR
jgi:protein-tyrosine kinase